MWTWNSSNQFLSSKSRLSRAKYTVILFPETPRFNAVIVALKSKEIKWSVLLDSLPSPQNRFKMVQTGSNRLKIFSLVLKFDVYSRTNGIFLGVFLCFTREKCEKVAFLFSKYLFLNFYQELGLIWLLSLWLDALGVSVGRRGVLPRRIKILI